MRTALEIVGLLLIVACVALFSWQIAIGVAGVLLVLLANLAPGRSSNGGERS